MPSGGKGASTDPRESKMSISFAEQILDSMVDESGNCGERGLSTKQYQCISKYLTEGEHEYIGSWEGDYSSIEFYHWQEFGYIGRYYVELEVTHHFHIRAAVKSIRRWIDELPTFEGSEWQFQPKQRKDMTLTLIRESRYERMAYNGWGTEMVSIYTMADDEGNCFVWKTTGALMVSTMDENGVWDDELAEMGDRIEMRATVKEHSEYRGIKQTVIVRPKVKSITKRA